jgi:negative regulator of flagellin synthesis FlgM
MKINHINESTQASVGATKSNGARAGSKMPETSSAGSEKLSISDLSTRLNDLETRLSGTKEFDAAKVEAIKQAIREGRFTVNADAVADRLLDSVKQMLGK